jgi:hypothetical protein
MRVLLFVSLISFSYLSIIAQPITRLPYLWGAERVIVEVTQPWTSTGIIINVGDTITILVSGVATTNINNDPVWVGPEGWGVFSNNDPIPAYSVVGKIGISGEPFYVARMTSFVANVSGELSLGYFDTYFSDNYGYYIAFVFHRSNSTTDTEYKLNNLPTNLILEQNYPNPFNPSTNIEYSIPNQNFVQLKIFDELGQEVKTLVSAELPAGNYKIKWDGTNNSGILVASGRYFYQVSYDNIQLSKKMILLK